MKWDNHILYRIVPYYTYQTFMCEFGSLFFNNYLSYYSEKFNKKPALLVEKVQKYFPRYPFEITKCKLASGTADYALSFLSKMSNDEKNLFTQKIWEITAGDQEDILFLFINYLQNYISEWEKCHEEGCDIFFKDEDLPYPAESRMEKKLEETTIDIGVFFPLNQENLIFIKKMLIIEIESENLVKSLAQPLEKIRFSTLHTVRFHIDILIELQALIQRQSFVVVGASSASPLESPLLPSLPEILKTSLIGLGYSIYLGFSLEFLTSNFPSLALLLTVLLSYPLYKAITLDFSKTIKEEKNLKIKLQKIFSIIIKLVDSHKFYLLSLFGITIPYSLTLFYTHVLEKTLFFRKIYAMEKGAKECVKKSSYFKTLFLKAIENRRMSGKIDSSILESEKKLNGIVRQDIRINDPFFSKHKLQPIDQKTVKVRKYKSSQAKEDYRNYQSESLASIPAQVTGDSEAHMTHLYRDDPAQSRP